MGDHKCMEACAAGKFATKGITNVGPCPTKYSTVDHTVTQEQCPDGVTNLRYCQSTKLNVTVTTKGEAGGFAAMQQLDDSTPGYVHQIITTPGDHCLEIVFPGGKSSPFWKSDGWKYGPPVRPEWKTGPCDQKKYNERDSQVKDYDGWTKDKNGGLGSVLQNKYGFGKKATETNAVSLADATPYCLFHEDTVDHKCMEACAAGKFATKGITNVGHCPTKYSTVDHTVTQEQCPDGVTNLRCCQSTKLNVTVTTKGEAGGFAAMQQLDDSTPGYVHQIITTPGDHCLEIVFPGGKSSPFWKSDGWKYGPPVRPEWKTGPCD